MRLRWVTQTQFAGYYVAHYKGFYDEQGLDVHVKPGVYGKNPLRTVKSSAEEFGVQWASDLIAESKEFISLANISKGNGFVLISKKNKNIKSIDDFRGKKISTWFIGHEYLLYALLGKYGINRNEVSIVSQRWDMGQFYNDEVDIASAQSYNELQEVLDKNYSINVLDVSRHGINFPGQNIFTTRKYYSKNPDVCRKLVKASIKGWEYAFDHPEETVDIVMKYDESGQLDKDFQLKQLKSMEKIINRDKYKLGSHLAEQYEYIIHVFEEYNIIKAGSKPEDYYTDEFVNN